MNNRATGAAASAQDQSALSLLVNAVDSHEPPHHVQREAGAAVTQRSMADSLRSATTTRGLSRDAGAGGPSLEEQLLLQQQAQGAFGGSSNSVGLLSQIRDQNILNQLGQQQQQQQLASLLGLGSNSNSTAGVDMRSALLAAQMRQQSQVIPQLSNADLLTIARGAPLPGLSGLFAGGGIGGGALPASATSGLASELEGLQRLEELERRHRLLASTSAASAAPISQSSYGRSDNSDPQSLSAAGPTLVRSKSNEQRLPAPREERSEPAGADHQVPAISASSRESSAATPRDKEELKKAPGSVIVPCRARGMPMDHNFKTAYFVIPENVKHGEELICSYFACRNAGIKFRYCSHCKVPVAKRNFRKRHKHGGDDVYIRGDDSGGEEENAAISKGIPSQIMTDQEEAADADALSSESESMKQQEKTRMSEAVMQQGPVQTSMQSKMALGGDIPSSEDDRISVDRRQRWAALLARRPATKDGDSMNAWLMEVLAVSDLETPLKPSEPEDGKDAIQKTAAAGALPPNEHGSSTDDSGRYGGINNVATTAPTSKTAPLTKGTFNGDIVKRKRPTDFLRDDPAPADTGAASGSFAEWKERKKQKKQSKLGGTAPSATVSQQEQL